MYKIIPEWNLLDLVQPNSDYLLNHLKHRATNSLRAQYRSGLNGAAGDCEFILENIGHLSRTGSTRSGFMLFINDAEYGQSFVFKETTDRDKMMTGLSTAISSGCCVSLLAGELILQRQYYLLSALNILVEAILEEASSSREKTLRPKKPEEITRTALSAMSTDAKPGKVSLQDILALALDQKNNLEDYLSLCRTEPVFLTHVVNNWFFSQPGLVPDEKGRIMPLVTDKYISVSIFEIIHDSMIGAAIWDYVCRLLQVLSQKINDRICRAIILQEMANICHFERCRVHKLFKRFVQMGSGSKYFKRVSGVYDDDCARVTMKIKPDVLTRKNPQLHYVLRLCQSPVDVASAVDWIKKLDCFHQTHPTETTRMLERELDAFGDIAVATSFIKNLMISLSLPPINPRKGQIYISRLKKLRSEIDSTKAEVDLSEFVVPTGNLLEAGVADAALAALSRFIVDKTGTELGYLYQDLNEDCLSKTENLCQQQKANVATITDDDFHIIDSPSEAKQVEERRQKHKTRPAHSSMHSISPAAATTATLEDNRASTVFKVKPETFKVFSALFSRSQSRGSISWTAFEAAMTDLNFSITPKWGSVFTFYPPQDFSVQQSLTLHRPHNSHIEGFRLLFIAKRLKQTFGWEEESFELA
ncbi:uncharacterized protein NFIA_045770 [Aspergillus fischeri NRRL 181]|uniref:Ipa protein n=1 Tax=Neosartorya fischeri (strain ATCC 1020 / DSM 3700 / CBS 544.65 / FGSC A1164 / JCM 1740 / NRRL 181 / WB 181) TaxID=331117 RepID=A1CVI0_NEOFI|nr:conserved hypothetical protein [Aspergillus fischeri NRRL 181]EAW25757.1 conserved hypothetical protein [Aspergillus fischeri NRRL 181]KAG2000850.1 hypothetical protein GB937_010769 [Aspergillus fischeri]